MSDFIDDFLSNLENDKPKPRTEFGRLNKLTMSAKDNQGTICIAPFMDPKTTKFYSILNGVREFKTTVTMFHEGKDSVWAKILPISAYGDLTEEQKNLHNEVSGLFDQYYKLVDNNKKIDTWSICRYRSYSLFQGIILIHTNAQGKNISEHENQPALLIYPSKNPITELGNAVSAKIANSKGSKSWLPVVFSPKPEGREGALSIAFTSKTNGQPGYDVAVAFEFNSTFNTVIDNNMQVNEDTLNLFGDFISEFLGWENAANSTFNTELFEQLKGQLTIAIKKLELDGTKKEDPVLENNNGKDPMIDATPQEETKPATPKEYKDFPF